METLNGNVLATYLIVTGLIAKLVAKNVFSADEMAEMIDRLSRLPQQAGDGPLTAEVHAKLQETALPFRHPPLSPSH